MTEVSKDLVVAALSCALLAAVLVVGVVVGFQCAQRNRHSSALPFHHPKRGSDEDDDDDDDDGRTLRDMVHAIQDLLANHEQRRRLPPKPSQRYRSDAESTIMATRIRKQIGIVTPQRHRQRQQQSRALRYADSDDSDDAI